MEAWQVLQANLVKDGIVKDVSENLHARSLEKRLVL